MSTPNPARAARASLTPEQRAREANARKRAGRGAVGSSDEDFEKKHPRGKAGTSEGGKFVRKGSTGSDVKAVQAKVGAETDGKFGPRTRAAVMDFQRRHGLTPDGIVGHATAVALAGYDGKRAQEGPLTPLDLRKLRRLAAKARKSPQRARGGVIV